MLTLYLQTLICLASCSFCLALPLADSAAEAEAAIQRAIYKEEEARLQASEIVREEK